MPPSPVCDQHIASTAWSSTPSTRPQNEDAESNRQKRTELADRDAFVSEVRDLKASLEHGNVKEDFVEEAVQVFRFEPSRLELLANGESTDGIWDRFEWTRDADGAWSEPRRLMPY